MTKIQNKTSKQNKIILCLMALIFAIFFVSSPINLLANANTVSSSPVLSDLKKDNNFSVTDYPVQNDNYNIKIIQVAETTEKELLIYVYMPCAVAKQLKLTTISISNEVDNSNNPSFNLYNLTLLNYSGVFFKYLVEDFEVKDTKVREYDIPEIHRTFDKDIDKEVEGQVVTEVPCEISQKWTAVSVDKEIIYYCENIEIIKIIDKFVGFVRYNTNNSHWNYSSCDRHFVAFSTNKNIDELIEADLEYSSQDVYIRDYNSSIIENYTEFEKIQNSKSYLKIDDSKNITANITTGLFGSHSFSYSWKSIQNINDFLKTVNTENMFTDALFNTTVTNKVTEDNINKLKSKQWVLSFDNTTFTREPSSHGYPYHENKTIVSDVTILRLKFKTEGQTYNLGVIDNKQTGSGSPINSTSIEKEFKVWNIIVKVLFGIGIVIGIVLVLKVLTAIINFIKSIFK